MSRRDSLITSFLELYHTRLGDADRCASMATLALVLADGAVADAVRDATTRERRTFCALADALVVLADNGLINETERIIREAGIEEVAHV